MKNIAILGSTGSIGTNALRVVDSLATRYRVVGLAAGKRSAELAQQASKYQPAWIYGTHPEELKTQPLPGNTRVLDNERALCDAVAADNVDVVLCAISGTGGLRPVLSAIAARKTIALASKEVLVMAGAIVAPAAQAAGVPLLPVDSEHCAIFQCLDQHLDAPLNRILLTCSGGPFRTQKDLDFATVTPQMALHHPTWNMGPKITMDSATLMNKGLEIIEAGWLFHVPEDKIEVVIHPQSIVHSMVEFADGSILAQLGNPDMCLPIHYCLNYPERVPSRAVPMDFTKQLTLTFEPPDNRRFPALALARRAMRAGGASGAIFNAANEVAVARFVEGSLRFDQIPAVVEHALDRLAPASAATLDDILDADRNARSLASRLFR